MMAAPGVIMSLWVAIKGFALSLVTDADQALDKG